MDQNSTAFNAEDLFGTLSDPGQFQRNTDGFEQVWRWPGEIGQGCMSMLKIRPGLLIGTGQYRLLRKIRVNFQFDYAPLMFSYGFCGSMRYDLKIKKRPQNLWGFRQGHSVMGYLPHWQGIAHPPVETPVSCAMVYMAPEIIETYLADQCDLMPPAMRDIATGGSNTTFYEMARTSPGVKAILHQILNCPYQGGLRRIFLEGKALELIAGSMTQFIPPAKSFQKKFTLRAADIKRIHHARALIARDVSQPPRLQDIAHTVGLSHPKLNYGFREIYGATLFGYLRELRLNKARELLDDGNMNVTEVAYEVGYSSLSYFAKAFKNHFGTAPGNYLRKAFGA